MIRKFFACLLKLKYIKYYKFSFMTLVSKKILPVFPDEGCAGFSRGKETGLLKFGITG